MINRVFKKRYMSLFTWGTVPINLGTNLTNENIEINKPLKVNAFEEHKPVKVEMSNCTGVLTEDGKLLSFGSNKYGQLGHGDNSDLSLPKTIKFFENNNIKIVDFSFGLYHSLALDSEGKVYGWGLGSNLSFYNKLLFKNMVNSIGELNNKNSNEPKEIEGIEGKVKQIFAGDTFSLALMENGEVYHWGFGRNGSIGFNIPGDYEIPEYLSEENYFIKPRKINELTELLKKLNTSIKKMKVNNSNIICLLNNGDMICWGEDRDGQLATGRTELVINYFEVLKPTLIKKTYEGKIVDFDISKNVLVVINDKNQVYYSGMNLKMSLSEIILPKNKIAKSVNACDNAYIIITKDNEILSSDDFLKSDRYHGKYKLNNIEFDNFENKEIICIGGHNKNRFVLTK